MKIKFLFFTNIFLIAQVIQDDSQIKIDKYLRILSENKNLHEANLSIGNIYYNSEQYGNAELYYKRSTESNKSKLKYKSFYNLGNSQFQQKKYEESLLSFKKSIELNPDDLDAKYNYELVKKIIEKNKNNSNQNNNKSDSENQNSEQDQQSDTENKNQQQNFKDKQGNNKKTNNSEDESSNKNNSKKIDKKNEQISPNAESILNALKANENNLIRPQIEEKKSEIQLKDW